MRRFKGINLASSNQNEREINVHILQNPRRSSLISEIRFLSALSAKANWFFGKNGGLTRS
ncbi:hypothetical protein [Peribacillus frigoritolerans]|uniref:hypothetical protein n=1 Tax=Peribacillus frigoritolerans TaxID=450367 RepID=UPI002E2016F0